MKKLLLSFSLLSFLFVFKSQSQSQSGPGGDGFYELVQGMELSHTSGGYSTVGMQNGRVWCMGIGNWSCDEDPTFGGHTDASGWLLIPFTQMKNHAFEEIGADPDALSGTYSATFQNVETNETAWLKVDWIKGDDGNYSIDLFKWKE